MSAHIPTLSVDDLRHADFGLAPPFYLRLADTPGNAPWLCRQVLRLLPGARAVLLLHRGNEAIVCKLFYRRRDFRREQRGLALLRHHGIDTPASRLKASHPRRRYWLIGYEYIAAPTAARALADGQPVEPIARTVTDAIAALHRAGLEQRDIHLDNFLCDHGRAWVVDAASIRTGGAMLPAAAARANFAAFLAQLPPDRPVPLAAIWQRYQRQLPDTTFSEAQLQRALTAARQRRWTHYRRKLIRDCSEFVTRRASGSIAIWRRGPGDAAAAMLLADPDGGIAAGETLKDGNTATVVRCRNSAGDWVIKRYNLKSLAHAISRALRPTRAWRGWYSAHYLQFCGVGTPTPLAVLEERSGPLRRRGFLVCAHVEAPPIDAYVAGFGDDANAVTALARQVETLFERLLAARISHGDLKASNILAGAEGLCLVDLDAVRRHRSDRSLRRALGRDLERFLDNWPAPVQAIFARELAAFRARLSDARAVAE